MQRTNLIPIFRAFDTVSFKFKISNITHNEYSNFLPGVKKVSLKHASSASQQPCAPEEWQQRLKSDWSEGLSSRALPTPLITLPTSGLLSLPGKQLLPKARHQAGPKLLLKSKHPSCFQVKAPSWSESLAAFLLICKGGRLPEPKWGIFNHKGWEYLPFPFYLHWGVSKLWEGQAFVDWLDLST